MRTRRENALVCTVTKTWPTFPRTLRQNARPAATEKAVSPDTDSWIIWRLLFSFDKGCLRGEWHVHLSVRILLQPGFVRDYYVASNNYSSRPILQATSCRIPSTRFCNNPEVVHSTSHRSQRVDVSRTRNMTNWLSEQRHDGFLCGRNCHVALAALTADAAEAHRKVSIAAQDWHLLGCRAEESSSVYVNTDGTVAPRPPTVGRRSHPPFVGSCSTSLAIEPDRGTCSWPTTSTWRQQAKSAVQPFSSSSSRVPWQEFCFLGTRRQEGTLSPGWVVSCSTVLTSAFQNAEGGLEMWHHRTTYT